MPLKAWATGKVSPSHLLNLEYLSLLNPLNACKRSYLVRTMFRWGLYGSRHRLSASSTLSCHLSWPSSTPRSSHSPPTSRRRRCGYATHFAETMSVARYKNVDSETTTGLKNWVWLVAIVVGRTNILKWQYAIYRHAFNFPRVACKLNAYREGFQGWGTYETNSERGRSTFSVWVKY